MELLQLIYFSDAAKTQNFSKTAEKFNVPPSNISQSVHRLEKELDTDLFDRSANRIRLNEKGKKFSERVEKSLNLLSEAKSIINDSEDKISGEIKICICTNRRIVTQTIEKFRKLYPDVSFIINHDNSSGSEFDLLVGDEGICESNLEMKLLIEESIILAVCKDNPIAKSERITAENLKYQRFITMPDKSSLSRHTNLICNSMNFIPDIAIRSDDPFYIRKYVDMGLGIAFVPSISWYGQFSDNTVFINIGDYKRSTYVYWDSKSYISKAVKMFLKELTEEVKNITKKTP